MAFLDTYPVSDETPTLTLGVSNGDEVISVGERRIKLVIPSTSGKYYDWQYKPIIDISMTILEDKVFSRNEIVVVEGIVEHMYKSKGESVLTAIRFVKELYIELDSIRSCFWYHSQSQYGHNYFVCRGKPGVG